MNSASRSTQFISGMIALMTISLASAGCVIKCVHVIPLTWIFHVYFKYRPCVSTLHSAICLLILAAVSLLCLLAFKPAPPPSPLGSIAAPKSIKHTRRILSGSSHLINWTGWKLELSDLPTDGSTLRSWLLGLCWWIAKWDYKSKKKEA